MPGNTPQTSPFWPGTPMHLDQNPQLMGDIETLSKKIVTHFLPIFKWVFGIKPSSHWSIQTMEYCLALKRKEALTPAIAQTDLDDAMLSAVSQTKRTDTVRFHACEGPAVVKITATGSGMELHVSWGPSLSLGGEEFWR